MMDYFIVICVRSSEYGSEAATSSSLVLYATDNDARIAVLEKIQDDTYENGPWLMIAQAPAHIAYNTRLDDVAASDPYSLDLTQITIK